MSAVTDCPSEAVNIVLGDTDRPTVEQVLGDTDRPTVEQVLGGYPVSRHGDFGHPAIGHLTLDIWTLDTGI